MKYTFVICLLLAGVGRGWASFYGDLSWDKPTCPQGCVSISTLVAIVKDYKEAAERQKRSVPYQVNMATISADDLYNSSIDEMSFYVINRIGDSWSLSNFVSSGKFCLIYGHSWKKLLSRRRDWIRCKFCLLEVDQ